VLHRFQGMHGIDDVHVLQLGDGAGDPQDSVICPAGWGTLLTQAGGLGGQFPPAGGGVGGMSHNRPLRYFIFHFFFYSLL
jgi:hypothetical protein